MKLLVKRAETATKGTFGGTKRKFDMTLKLELSPEEQATVEKFGLKDAFDVKDMIQSNADFTYAEFMAGKTFSHEQVKYLFLQFDMVQTVLKVANGVIKSHALFPGEAVIEID